jgi:hypothetical protein
LQQDRALIATLGVNTPDVTPWNMLGFEDHPMRHLQRSKLFAEKNIINNPLPKLRALHRAQNRCASDISRQIFMIMQPCI